MNDDTATVRNNHGPTTPVTTLGENLLAVRRRLGLSQEQFADRLRVSRQTVSAWESDESIPGADRIKDIHIILGVAYTEIYEGADATVNSSPTGLGPDTASLRATASPCLTLDPNPFDQPSSDRRPACWSPSDQRAAWEPVGAIIMLLAVAYYFIAGFVFHAWGTQWWVFPIGGIAVQLFSVCQSMSSSRKKSVRPPR